ncbi:type III effector protein [Kitasatospora sp. NPDC051914]|uniref:type III effector protein n=1 Tax=Kitasatospora sp. NPDC051914 TaxID=3154945 RepID=UPI0034189CA6
MTAPERGTTPEPPVTDEAARPLLTALTAMTRAVTATDDGARDPADRALHALSALQHLRQALDQWEPHLVETARGAGATWADLSGPLGVRSRQAAERRYLRTRRTASAPGTTQDQRVRAERDRRAAERSVTAWARANPTTLRSLAGQIAALDTAAYGTRRHLATLRAALGADDAALLLEPLEALAPLLAARRPDLAARIDALVRHADRLRRDSDQRRN